MAYVYIHRRNDTGAIFYVGIGGDTLGKHDRANWAYKRNRYWHNIVNKHGRTVEITHDNIVWEEACVIEKYLISFYGRINLGTGCLINLTDGGDGTLGMRLSNEAKEKISKMQKGRRLSDEHKGKIGNGNRGKLVSGETRKKLSVANFGKKHSEETLSKLRLARKNRKISDRHKAILIKSGVNARMRILLNVETGIYYLGFGEAARSVGLKRTTLNAMFSGQSTNRTKFILV